MARVKPGDRTAALALALGGLLLSACSGADYSGAGPSFRYLGKETLAPGAFGESYRPEAGMVASPATAARIAETVAEGLYGEEQIRRQRPCAVSETPTLWIVRGQLPQPSVGGVFEIAINKRDGAIVHVIHGK